MDFEEAMREAARSADRATRLVTGMYRRGELPHEEDITGALVGALAVELSGSIGGLKWTSRALKHRAGSAREESVVGADIYFEVRLSTPSHHFRKGALVQAKRIDREVLMGRDDWGDLQGQCNKMLDVTAESYVFCYDRHAIRAGSATKIAGASGGELYKECGWTAYRFYLELFKCPVGDPKLTRPVFERALKSRLEESRVHGLIVHGEGDLTDHKGR